MPDGSLGDRSGGADLHRHLGPLGGGRVGPGRGEPDPLTGQQLRGQPGELPVEQPAAEGAGCGEGGAWPQGHVAEVVERVRDLRAGGAAPRGDREGPDGEGGGRWAR
ncbi:hypothetical protein GCM10020254_56180 [Streptomyces goshikiensis]